MSACDFNLDRITAVFTLALFKLAFDKRDLVNLVDVVFTFEMIEDLWVKAIEDFPILVRSDFKNTSCLYTFYFKN